MILAMLFGAHYKGIRPHLSYICDAYIPFYHRPNVLYWFETWCLCTPHGTMDVLQCSRNQLCDIAHLPYGSSHQKKVYWSARIHNCLPVRQQQWNDSQLVVRVPKVVRKKSFTPLHRYQYLSVPCPWKKL